MLDTIIKGRGLMLELRYTRDSWSRNAIPMLHFLSGPTLMMEDGMFEPHLL